MNKLLIILVVLSSLSCNKSSGDTDNPSSNRDGLYSNGQLATGTSSNSGVAAPAGTQWSEAQHDAGNLTIANQTIGIACYFNSFSRYRLADDFIIPAGQTWKISGISVYVMNNGATASMVDSLYLQIWNGKPSLAGSAVVYGDLSTNILSGSIDSLLYCIQNSSVPAPGIAPHTGNQIYKLSANITTTLNSGTYWLVWQAHRKDGTACYSPLVKVKGSRGLTGWNAIVYSSSIPGWQTAADPGTPVTFPLREQDVPFEIVYKY